MAFELKTETTINSAPEKIWSLLVDFKNYPKWNPFITSLTGDVKVGNTIQVRIEPPNGKGMTFRPTILTYEINRELSWMGHLLFTGLFDGEHKFELVDNGNSTTTFKQSEMFKGILVSLFKKQLDNDTRKGFEEMNRKLKELAEQE